MKSVKISQQILKKYLVSALVFMLMSTNLTSVRAASVGIDVKKISVLSSENISSDNSSGILKVYLNTFKPKTAISFEIQMNNQDTQTVTNDSQKLLLPPDSSFVFSITSVAVLTKAAIDTPFREIQNSSGNAIIQIFPTPPDFPVISLSGDTSLVAKREILSTPVVATGTYVISSVGTGIRYFYKSPNNIIGFRKITDASAIHSLGGTPVYAFLEQTQFDVTATSPGSWKLLDSNFQNLQGINAVKTKFGTVLPEGHGMTVAPSGNAIVITTVTRKVDSSWLSRAYKLPILDCDIAEVVDGKAVNEFSFWDWAVANKSISKPLLDAMPLFNDPQNPTSSPIDVCHANSLQYYKSTNQFLISLRSPSILMILSANLKTVKQIIPTNGSLQHFARFRSPTEISALGNYTFDKVSKFLDFKLVNGKWVLTEIPFPVHVTYCGNTQFIDATHVWLGGGCGPFTVGTIGAIYKLASGALQKIGEVKMQNFNYSYRADLP